MVAQTALELARRGCARFSLNFTVRRRLFIEEARLSVVQRMEAAVLGWLNPFFQIERLGHFNEKFSPTWRPRYIYYEAPISLPRVLLAYLEAEELLRIPFVGARARLKTRLRRRSLRKALA
jgi:lysyl-tRNA synthetase class 2